MIHRIVAAGLLLVAIVVGCWTASADSTPPTTPASAPIGEVAVAVAGELETRAAATRALVPAPPSSPVTSTSSLTLRLTGAPIDELRGIAAIRRKDGSSVDVPFERGGIVIDDPTIVDGLAVRIPGFAIAWPELVANRDEIVVPMLRAGAIRIHLLDTTGAALGERSVWFICQATAAPAGARCQGNGRGTTGSDGIAVLDHAVPGSHRVGALGIGEWDSAIAEGVVVAAGVTTDVDLVAPVLPPSGYGGFWFPIAKARDLQCKEGLVVGHVFRADTGDRFELRALGGCVRCVIRGVQGQVVRGAIVAIEAADEPLTDPIPVTVGAMLAWEPRWKR